MTTNLPASPQHGDVVIARDARGGLYTISVMPGDPQVRYPTLEQAVAVASEWAVRARVAVWLTKDGRTFAAVDPAHSSTPASDMPRFSTGKR